MSLCHLSKQSIAGRKWLSVFLAILAALRPARLLANPTGMTVGSGTAVALPTGSQLNITVGPTALCFQRLDQVIAATLGKATGNIVRIFLRHDRRTLLHRDV